jgi:hypothetical protein
LTKKGEKLADEAIALYFNSLGEIWGPIGERNLAQLTQLLAALLAITESRAMTGTQEGATTERAKLPKGFETKSAHRGKVQAMGATRTSR